MCVEVRGLGMKMLDRRLFMAEYLELSKWKRWIGGVSIVMKVLYISNQYDDRPKAWHGLLRSNS